MHHTNKTEVNLMTYMSLHIPDPTLKGVLGHWSIELSIGRIWSTKTPTKFKIQHNLHNLQNLVAGL